MQTDNYLILVLHHINHEGRLLLVKDRDVNMHEYNNSTMEAGSLP